MWGELARSLQSGNGYVIAILSVGFIAFIVFFERMIMLQAVYNIDFNKFINNLKKMVLAEDLSRAITLCKNTSSTSLPKIAWKALEAAETDPTKVRGAIEEETMEFLPHIERRIAALPALTLLIMLIGILGTIDSLWTSFQAIDVLDTAKKQATLAQGIASSLAPTALSLLFGLILLSGYYVVKGMAVGLTEHLHYGITVVTNLLAPRDTVAYIPMPGSGDMPSAGAPEAAPSQDANANSTDAPANPAEESFDDVSIEDIKDEEEII
jgi:biopolymer transport protein ExbB/TolQ